MAIIYSYPTVNPERTDLILGTDVSTSSKATKNFTVQSIIDLVTVATGDLQTVLDLGNVATAKDINLTNNSFRGGSFITTANATITGTTATGFTNVTSTAFTGTLATAAQPNVTSLGTLSALVISGPISGTGLITNSNLTGAQNDNVVSTLAIKTYVDTKVGLYDTLSEVLANGNTTSGTDIAVSSNDDITFADDSKILMGASNDLQIYHGTLAGSNQSWIRDIGTNDLILDTNGSQIALISGGVVNNGKMGLFKKDGAVELYYDNIKKIETLTGGAKVTGAFQATTSGTFASLINTGTYSDSSGDVGTAGQILSSTATGTNWVTEVPLYNWSLEGTAIPSGTAVTVTDGTNITTTWDATNFDLTIATTGVPDGSGTANQVTFWSDANTLTGAAGLIFAGGSSGKVTVAGELQAGTLSDGTFSGSAGTYTGGVSITSTDFVGALTGNASTATALASSGAISLSGDTVSTGGPHTYTSGGAVTIPTTIADTTVTGKVLTNLATPTSVAIAASDTILAAMAKLQGQITGIPQGLVYKGTWNATTNTPTLASGTGVTGEFYIVSVAGTTNLDGITDWQVGDWAIFVEVGATDTWQKIDNTSAILGSGTANKIAKWTGSNTLATGLIADDGTTVTVGNSGNFIVEGNTTLGDADTDSTTVKGPAVFEETSRFNVGISLGAATYGTAGQVLTSGGGAASVNTWTTPTVGTVTSVTGLYGITIAGTTAVPTIAVTSDTNNLVHLATVKTNPVAADTILINDSENSDVLKQATISSILTLDPARSLAATLAIGNTTGGTTISVSANDDIDFTDTSEARFGSNQDLIVKHNGSSGVIQNKTGNLSIENTADDSDIKFLCDNGTGGTEVYFELQGVSGGTSPFTVFPDNSNLVLGNGHDFRLYHTGSKSLIENYTGDIEITNFSDDSDIVFKSDDGSGGVTTYFKCKGDESVTQFVKDTNHQDNTKATFGTSLDLQIFHDASNSIIAAAGTGNLNISTNSGSVQINKSNSENMAEFITDGAVNLYHNSFKKFETTSTGITVSGQTISDAIVANGVITCNNAGSDKKIAFRRTGGNSFSIEHDSAFIYFYNETTSSVIFKMANNNDTTFTGNVEIDGNLTVDGSIIHGGGKSGIFNGNVATNNNTVDLFKITRTGNSFQGGGQLIFDVYATSELSGGGVLKYTVAHRFNVAPVYNKIIDSQGTNTMALTFTNSTSTGGTAGDSVLCQVTTNSTQNISYTVQVGFSNANTVFVT